MKPETISSITLTFLLVGGCIAFAAPAPRHTLLVHPDEFTDAWIERAAAIGCDGLFLHPVGSGQAEASAARLLELLREPSFRARIDRARARGLEIGYEMHVGSWLVPRSLFAEHPEYFRLGEDGKRTPKTNFCLSNEKALEIAARRSVELAQALYGSSHRYFFWMDDVRDGTCRCEKCREYSGSEQQLLFANRIVGELRKTIPDAQLCYLAYLGTMDVPERVKPAEGVFLEYAPLDRDMKRPLDEQQGDARLGSLAKLLEKFGRKDARVLDYWFDNSLLSGWKKPPKKFVPRPSVVWSDLSFYRELGFEDIASFACYLGDDYEKLWGPPDVTPFAKCHYKAAGGPVGMDAAEARSWKLAYADEFDGGRLDGAKWLDFNPAFLGRPGTFVFARNNVAVKDGCLELTAREITEAEKANDLRGLTTEKWATATVKSRERILYGYFEARIRSMKANVCNAFWLYDPLSDDPQRKHKAGDESEEIDVVEVFGKTTNDHCRRAHFATLHRYLTPYSEAICNQAKAKIPDGGQRTVMPYDFWADYHVYGCKWTEESITWYVDGKEVFTRKNDHWKRPLHVMLDCEIMSGWSGEPESADLPAKMSIDYVRVWKNERNK